MVAEGIHGEPGEEAEVAAALFVRKEIASDGIVEEGVADRLADRRSVGGDRVADGGRLARVAARVGAARRCWGGHEVEALLIAGGRVAHRCPGMRCSGVWRIGIQPDKGLDVFREGKEIEDLESRESKAPGGPQRGEVCEQSVEATGEVDQTSGRPVGEGVAQRRIESAPRRVDHDQVRALERVEPFARGAREEAGAPAFRGGPMQQPELEPRQPRLAAFVEADLPGASEAPQTDRSDPAIELGDRRVVAHQCVDAVDGPGEERQVALSEGGRGKEDVDAAERLAKRRFTGEPDRAGAEDRVAALGLSVEEESLESVPEPGLEGSGELAQHVRGRPASHENDLDPLALPLDGDLYVSQCAAVGLLGIGLDPGFADRLPQQTGDLVDPRMVDGAAGRIDDAMGARLEEADLGAAGPSADGESGAMTMSMRGQGVDRWLRQAGLPGQVGQGLPGRAGERRRAEARAARAGRTMRAGARGRTRRRR